MICRWLVQFLKNPFFCVSLHFLHWKWSGTTTLKNHIKSSVWRICYNSGMMDCTARWSLSVLAFILKVRFLHQQIIWVPILFFRIFFRTHYSPDKTIPCEINVSDFSLRETKRDESFPHAFRSFENMSRTYTKNDDLFILSIWLIAGINPAK